MKDEIKEILDYLKNDNYFTESSEYEVSPYDLYKSLNSVQTDKLLDYITNLQEENKKLKHKLEQMYNDTKDTYNEICAEQIDYKSRNEKAIEYINSTGYGTDFSMSAEEVDNLLNILQGDDKE